MIYLLLGRSEIQLQRLALSWWFAPTLLPAGPSKCLMRPSPSNRPRGAPFSTHTFRYSQDAVCCRALLSAGLGNSNALGKSVVQAHQRATECFEPIKVDNVLAGTESQAS